MSNSILKTIEKYNYINRLQGIYKFCEKRPFGEFITFIQSGVINKNELLERSNFINPVQNKEELLIFNAEIAESFNGIFKKKISLYSKRCEEVKDILLTRISKKINLTNKSLQNNKDHLFLCISLLFAFESFSDTYSLKKDRYKKPNLNLIIAIIIGFSLVLSALIYAYSNRYYVHYPYVIDKWTKEISPVKKSN